LIIINNDVFPQRFHCINIFTSFLLNQEYFTKASSANNFLNQEILKSNFFITGSCIESLRSFSKAMIFWVTFWEVILEGLQLVRINVWRCCWYCATSLWTGTSIWWWIVIFIAESVILFRNYLNTLSHIFFWSCIIFKLWVRL